LLVRGNLQIGDKPGTAPIPDPAAFFNTYSALPVQVILSECFT